MRKKILPSDNLDLFKHLFYRDLFEATGIYNKANSIRYIPQDTALPIEYKQNSHGYRSDEFEKNNKVLILGCSQTYGLGIPKGLIWTDFFCDSVKESCSILAYPGDSIGGQVYKTFRYFEEVGHPETIIGVFPLYRLETVNILDKFQSSNIESDKKKLDMAYLKNERLLKFHKAPYDPVSVIPQEFSIFYNFMFLSMLEQYCSANNINFMWTLYENADIEQYLYDNKMLNVLKNYFHTSDILNDFKYLYQNQTKIKVPENHETCHKEFEDHPLFYWASDYVDGINYGHWGIHVHQHMAEKVIRAYKEKIK